MTGQPKSLVELLDRVGEAGKDQQRVAFKDILEAVGRSSFGPLVLLAGVITLTPIVGDIPGVPTILGVLVVLTTGQMLLGRSHFWFPRWLLRRSLKREKVKKIASWGRKPARWIDRVLRVRLAVLTEGAGAYVVAASCLLIGAAMPAMDFVPFSANAAGVILTLYGLSLIARDGLLALVGFLLTGVLLTLVAITLL